MEFVELRTCENALTCEVRERAKRNTHELTKNYSVRENGAEVAYVALERHDRRYLILYEMFVPEALRQQGIGSRILAETERLAKAESYPRVLLIAHPLEPYPQEKLAAWYRRRGFEKATGHWSSEAMVKDVP